MVNGYRDAEGHSELASNPGPSASQFTGEIVNCHPVGRSFSEYGRDPVSDRPGMILRKTREE
jgi:hypothetical protein